MSAGQGEGVAVPLSQIPVAAEASGEFVDMRRAKRERRRHPRLFVARRVEAILAHLHVASLIDISAGGALIEHADPVRPGIASVLTLLVRGDRWGLNCRVVRSVVHRYQVGPTGERDLIYRTGLEFTGPAARLPTLNR
jgi:hypothetical protein